jgi:hypothetical protein
MARNRRYPGQVYRSRLATIVNPSEPSMTPSSHHLPSLPLALSLIVPSRPWWQRVLDPWRAPASPPDVTWVDVGPIGAYLRRDLGLPEEPGPRGLASDPLLWDAYRM